MSVWLWPLILWLYKVYLITNTKIWFSIVLLYISLYTIYNINYFINDIIDYNSSSKLQAKRDIILYINKKIFLTVHLIIIIITLIISSHLLGYKLVILPTLLLIYAIIIHNSISEKAERYASFTMLRLSKYLYVPLAMNSLELLYLVFISMIPLLAHDLVEGYGWKLAKRAPNPECRSLAPGRIKRVIKYGVFIPFQAVLAWLAGPYYVLVVLPWLGLALAGLVRGR